MKKHEYTTKSSEETRELSNKIVQLIQHGGVVCLYGELGSGKTTFTQGLAEGIGIKRRVNSPTFIIMRSYEIPSQLLFPPRGLASRKRREHQRELTRSYFSVPSKNKRYFYHLDLYRVTSQKDIEGLGIEEILEDSANIVVIEWPEKIEEILPEKRINIYFNYLGDEERKIIIHEN